MSWGGKAGTQAVAEEADIQDTLTGTWALGRKDRGDREMQMLKSDEFRGERCLCICF